MKEICVYNKKLRVRHITMQIRQMVEILIKNSQSDNKDYKFSDEIFYFDDGNLFWGHTIEVTINQNLEFIDANIVG